MTPLNFAADPAPVSWPARVREYLAAMPVSPFTPAQDLDWMQCAVAGRGYPSYAAQQRVAALLRAARDDRGGVALDGQRALIDAIRDRTGQVARR